MERAFVIAEKPDYLKKIMSAYHNHEDEFDFELDGTAQVGHIFGFKSPSEIDEELKKWDLELFPWFPDGIPYKLTPVRGHRTSNEIFSDIKHAVNSDYDFIIHAGDPDQEGEVLIRESLMMARNELPVKRLWVNATNESDIVEALKKLEPDSSPKYENMFQAGLARGHADYLVGMNLSPVGSLKCGETLNIGRLKTFIVSLIAAREEAIKTWVPSSTYGVTADFDGFRAETKENYDTEDQANSLISGLSDTAKVLSYEKKRVKTKAPAFFKLSTLQMAASTYGIDIDETQDICQRLYDNGIMTYPRTSCECVGETIDFSPILRVCEIFEDLKPFCEGITPADVDRVKGDDKYVSQKKVNDAGHQALTPTGKPVVLSSLSEHEQIIFHLVCKQIVAAFLPPLVENSMKAELDIDSETFTASGKSLVEKGFTELMGYKGEDKIIPELKEGDSLKVIEYGIAEHKAKKPSRFTKRSLIDILEAPGKLLEDENLKKLGKKGIIDVSIGQPSTRSPIIKQLCDLGYLHEEKKKSDVVLSPTEKGTRYAENLSECTLCMADTTAMWEEKLEKIRRGELDRKDFETEIKEYIKEEVENLKKKEMVVYGGLCECHFCGGTVVEKPKNYTCISCHATVWKNNKYFEAIGKRVTEKIAKDILGTGKTHLTGLKSKKGNMYDADVIATPGEKGLSFKMDFGEGEKTPLCTCPDCGGTVYADGRGYFCENKGTECNVGIYKTDKYFAGMGIAVSKDLAQVLIEDKVAFVKGLKSKKGKRFDANVHVTFEGKYPTYQLSFNE